jgi:hypothetical protein
VTLGSPEPPPPPRASALYAALQRIEGLVQQAGGNRFKLRGRIAVQSGVSLELIGPDSPDDPEQLERLLAAARSVLGRDL